MPGILETFLASAFAAQIDANGTPQHQCNVHQPISIGEIEAGLLMGFDSSSHSALIESGVAVDKIAIEDFEMVATLVDEIQNQIPLNGNSKQDFLYKHAIAARLGKSLLMSADAPSRREMIACAGVFQHPWQEY